MAQDTDKYIDRPFNIRPFCFWVFFVGLTVVICLWSQTVGTWVAAVYFVLVICAFIVLQSTHVRDAVLKFLGSSHVFLLITVTLCLCAAVSFVFTTVAYTNQESLEGTRELSGTVESHRVREDGSGYFTLSSAKFGEKSVNGRIQVYFTEMGEEQLSKIVTTHRVSFTTDLNSAPANDININNRIKYTANIEQIEITSMGEDMELRHIVTRYARTLLEKVLDGKSLELMLAMLFGDRSTLDDEVNQDFASVGMSHALAVSGLHVGIIVGILLAVLKLFRIGRPKQFPIIVLCLLFYCYLCGFRYPIMRSSLMFIVLLVNRIYLRSGDFLSAICAAAVVILLIFPYSLFSVSFQFSFACVLGIAFFRRPVEKVIKRFIKRPKFISSGLSAYLTTVLMWLPLSIQYFGYFSVVGIIANVLYLPIIVVSFQICVIVAATYITYPLLYIVWALLGACLPMIHFLGSLPFVRLYISGSGYFFLLYYIGIVFLTQFVFIKRKYKYSVSAVLIAVYLLSLLL